MSRRADPRREREVGVTLLPDASSVDTDSLNRSMLEAGRRIKMTETTTPTRMGMRTAAMTFAAIARDLSGRTLEV